MRGRTLRLAAGVLVAALAVALAGALAGCSSQSASTGSGSAGGSKTPIKLGAIVSLTGSYAGIGTPQKATIEMEVKAINAAGGINGRPVEVLIEDDGTDEAKAVAAVTKLVEQDKVLGIIGTSGTGPTMAIRSEIDRAGVPEISMAGGNAVTGKFDPLVFQTAWSNALCVPFELSRIKGQNITKVGVISDSGGYGKDGLALLQSEVASFGITITSNQTFNVGDADMTAQLTNIKNSGAQAVIVWTAGAEATTIVKNAKSLGLTIPLFGCPGNARLEFAQGVGAAGDGYRFAAGHILLPETYGVNTDEYKTATDFVTRFKADNGGTPPSTFAGHAYDALHIFVNAAKTINGDVTPAALRDAVEKTSAFPGIGGVFTFTASDHNGLTDKDLTFYEVKGGQFTLASN